MTKKYDAIVVGAGIGGLATALMLAHRGRKTLLLEKNRMLGGRLSSSKKGDFHVDIGVHLISRSDKGPVGEVLRRVGIPNPITYTFVRPLSSYSGRTFVFPHDLKNMVPDKEFTALMSFLGHIRSMSPEKVKEYDHMDLRTFLFHYSQEPLVHACVNNVCTIYVAVPSWLASAGEFMRCLRMEAEAKASGYPEGGCSAISNTYGDGIRKFGGEIKLGAEVQKIEIQWAKVKGVIVGDTLYQADVVVSNADIKNTVLKLVGAEYFPSDYVDYVKSLMYSCGGPVVRVAVNKKLTDIKMLSQIGTTDLEGYYKKLDKGEIPDELNLFMVIPSNFSPTVAPEGKQLVCITTFAMGKAIDMKEEMTEAMLETAGKYIPGLRQNALWINTMSRNELKNMMGEDGAGIGIGQTASQCGDKRPKIKTPIEGLYIVGGEAGGTGVGVELCINSAIEFIDVHCPIA